MASRLLQNVSWNFKAQIASIRDTWFLMEMRCLRTMLSLSHYLSLSSAWAQGRATPSQPSLSVALGNSLEFFLSECLPTQKDKLCIGKTIPATFINYGFRISLCSETELFFSLEHWWWKEVVLRGTWKLQVAYMFICFDKIREAMKIIEFFWEMKKNCMFLKRRDEELFHFLHMWDVQESGKRNLNIRK